MTEVGAGFMSRELSQWELTFGLALFRLDREIRPQKDK